MLGICCPAAFLHGYSSSSKVGAYPVYILPFPNYENIKKLISEVNPSWASWVMKTDPKKNWIDGHLHMRDILSFRIGNIFILKIRGRTCLIPVRCKRGSAFGLFGLNHAAKNEPKRFQRQNKSMRRKKSEKWEKSYTSHPKYKSKYMREYESEIHIRIWYGTERDKEEWG